MVSDLLSKSAGFEGPEVHKVSVTHLVPSSGWLMHPKSVIHYLVWRLVLFSATPQAEWRELIRLPWQIQNILKKTSSGRGDALCDVLSSDVECTLLLECVCTAVTLFVNVTVYTVRSVEMPPGIRCASVSE
jgi:hypothetical protein